MFRPQHHPRICVDLDFFEDPDISVNLTFSKFSFPFLVVVVRLFNINCNKFRIFRVHVELPSSSLTLFFISNVISRLAGVVSSLRY